MENDPLAKFANSPFRSRFKLSLQDKAYIQQKGLDTIRLHAQDFIKTWLAPAFIPNDGKQTPMRHHPVFVAQHATATCCRGCLAKWHHIPAGTQLTDAQQEYIVNLIMLWIEKQLELSRTL